jgi:hypothetical protein
MRICIYTSFHDTERDGQRNAHGQRDGYTEHHTYEQRNRQRNAHEQRDVYIEHYVYEQLNGYTERNTDA